MIDYRYIFDIDMTNSMSITLYFVVIRETFNKSFCNTFFVRKLFLEGVSMDMELYFFKKVKFKSEIVIYIILANKLLLTELKTCIKTLANKSLLASFTHFINSSYS